MAVCEPLGTGLEPDYSDVRQEAEIERLFEEARALSLQSTRERLQHQLAKSLLAMRTGAEEQKLRGARARTDELTRQAEVFERAIYARRAAHAARLLGRSAHEDVNLSSWQRLIARVPQTRKQRVGNDICTWLRQVDLEHLEFILQPPGETFSAGACLARRSTGLVDEEEVQMEAGTRAGDDKHAKSPRGTSAAPPVGRTDSQESQDRDSHTMPGREQPRDASSSQGGAAEEQAARHSCEGPSNIWRWKVVLRSHLDAVRCVACDEDVLLSCGEDGLIKAWDMSVFRRARYEPERWEDMEPHATYRWHTGSVLSCTRHLVGQEDIFFSGGQDASLRAWRLLPKPDHDPYETPAPGALQPSACRLRTYDGHSDAVWALAGRASLGLLASASADATVRIWSMAAALKPQDTRAQLRCLDLEAGRGPQTQSANTPTSLVWLPRSGLLMAGCLSSRCDVFDIETGNVVRTVEGKTPPSLCSATPEFMPSAVTSLCCHARMDLAISGHVDGMTRVCCASTGKQVLSLGSDGAAVASVAVDPHGGYGVAVGSHDGYVRYFDIRVGECKWTTLLHKNKFDEAVHSVVHTGDHLVTAGADSNIVVLRLMD